MLVPHFSPAHTQADTPSDRRCELLQCFSCCPSLLFQIAVSLIQALVLFAGHHFYIPSGLISLSPRCLQDKRTDVCFYQDPWFLGIQPDLTGADVCTASVPWLSRFRLPHLHAIMPSVSQTKIIVSPWPCLHVVCLCVFAPVDPSGWSASLSLPIRVLYFL